MTDPRPRGRVSRRLASALVGGPDDGRELRWPGAVGAFALLGEALWVGILVSVSSVLLVTAPAAMAAGVAHLRRYLRGERTTVGDFFADLWRALRGGLLVGIVVVALAAVVAVDLLVVAGGGLPGALPIGVALALILGAVLVVVLTACSAWSRGASWRRLLRGAAATSVSDARGTLLTVVALGLAVVITWQYALLVVPVLGMLAFALAVVAERRTLPS